MRSKVVQENPEGTCLRNSLTTYSTRKYLTYKLVMNMWSGFYSTFKETLYSYDFLRQGISGNVFLNNFVPPLQLFVCFI